MWFECLQDDDGFIEVIIVRVACVRFEGKTLPLFDSAAFVFGAGPIQVEEPGDERRDNKKADKPGEEGGRASGHSFAVMRFRQGQGGEVLAIMEFKQSTQSSERRRGREGRVATRGHKEHKEEGRKERNVGRRAFEANGSGLDVR